MSSYNRTKVRAFQIDMKDGRSIDVESFSFPWQYREWFCWADTNETVHYAPLESVDGFIELVDAD